MRAVEAALAALHILTAPNMPKRAYLEDVIERIVQLARFQLQHSVYPAYDPVYRTEKKDSISSGIFKFSYLPSYSIFFFYSQGVQKRRERMYAKFEIKLFFWSTIKW